MWLAKDLDNKIYLYIYKPFKSEIDSQWYHGNTDSFLAVDIPESISSKLSWYDEEPKWIRFIPFEITYLEEDRQIKLFQKCLCG